MSEYPPIHPQTQAKTAVPVRAAGASVAATPDRTRTHGPAPEAACGDSASDPVTDWLLQRNDLGDTEFTVLFAIHKLSARRRHGGWVAHGDLCRSAGLAPSALGRILESLRRRGLLGMMHHPAKTGWARYLLFVPG